MTSGCKNGMFGIGCGNHCSGNCLHHVPCNSINGHCDKGCDSGYLDVFCNKSMYTIVYLWVHYIILKNNFINIDITLILICMHMDMKNSINRVNKSNKK